jgi:ABC-2 type transport system permease protein
MRFLSYLFALSQANWREHYGDAGRALFLSGFMFVQNLLFFALWAIFFHAVAEIRGWRFHDVSLLYGIVAFAVGLAMFVCDGARQLPLLVQEGSFDSLVARPRHPLPALLLNRSSASSLGDLVSAPFYWFVFGDMTMDRLPLLLALSLLAATIFQSSVIIAYSVAFWLPRGGGRLSDQLFEVLVIAATVPQHGQSWGIKLALFSIIPAGFISLTPVSLMQNFNALSFAGLAIAALVYVTLAIIVFNAGLKRYISQEAGQAT